MNPRGPFASTEQRRLAYLVLMQRGYWSFPAAAEQLGTTFMAVVRDMNRFRDAGLRFESDGHPDISKRAFRLARSK